MYAINENISTLASEQTKLEDKSQIALIVQSIIVIILFFICGALFYILKQNFILHNKDNLFIINCRIMHYFYIVSRQKETRFKIITLSLLTLRQKGVIKNEHHSLLWGK